MRRGRNGRVDIRLGQPEPTLMNLVLNPESEAILQRLVASGRYGGAAGVLEAGLQKLNAEANTQLESFPPGSLAHLFTDERNLEEAALVKGSSLVIE